MSLPAEIQRFADRKKIEYVARMTLYAQKVHHTGLASDDDGQMTLLAEAITDLIFRYLSKHELPQLRTEKDWFEHLYDPSRGLVATFCRSFVKDTLAKIQAADPELVIPRKDRQEGLARRRSSTQTLSLKTGQILLGRLSFLLTWIKIHLFRVARKPTACVPSS